MPRAYPAFVLALSLLAAGLVLFVPAVLADGDTFLHIAAGNWMLAHHAVLHADPFSATAAGQPWVAHEWLSEIVMALAWRAGGVFGLLVPFALAFALSVLLLGAAFRRFADPVPAAVGLLGAVFCITPSLLARPHLLVLPIMVYWAAAMLQARAEHRAPPLWVALLMVAWVNLHGSFFVGLAFAAGLAGEAWLLGERPRLVVFREWAVFGALSTVACLVSPHGLAGLLLPFHLLRVPALSGVSEWEPTNFGTLQPILPLIFGLLYLGLVYTPRLPRLRVVMMLGVLYTALTHTRNQLLFGVFGLLLLAEPLGRALRQEPPAPPPERVSRPAWAVFALALLALCAVRARVPQKLTDSITRPITALAHVPPALKAQPVLNGYSFGSWLIFKGIPPYIDSRVELYGNDRLVAYRKMMRPDHALLEAALARHHIAWTLFLADSPAAQMMDLLPGWKRLYTGKVAVIHVRDGG